MTEKRTKNWFSEIAIFSEFQTVEVALGKVSRVSVKRSMKELLYEVRCLKSNKDMIFALAGQFKQLSHEPENFSGDSTGFEPMTSAMPVQCYNQLSYKVTQLRA